jgi:hypothetical protein
VLTPRGPVEARSREMRRFLCAVVFLVALASHVSSAGLRTTFVKVTLENLRIGNTYNIREMANLPLAVYNTGDEPVDLRVEATIPIKGELREGYEPVPDVSWIVIRQDSFMDMKPEAVAMTDVLVSIPDTEEHLGKSYQVMIWSHTVGEGLIACGLKSEILFSISKTRDEPRGNFNVFPTEIHVKDVEIGSVYDVRKNGSGVTLKVFNLHDEEREFDVESIRVADSPLELDEGYLGCPDPHFLVLSDSAFTLGKHGEKEIEIDIAFPEDDEYTGKRYMFVIQTCMVDEPESGVYSKVYVSVEK